MKSLILLCLLATSISALDTTNKFRKTTLLPSTPKGDLLADHFGANPENSPYGPQPTLLTKLVTVTHEDGTVEARNVTQIIHVSDDILAKKCDLGKMDNYEICLKLTDCDLCTASPYCGWCEVTARCLPGTLHKPTCPQSCINGFFFDHQSCTGKVKSGSFANMAPDATMIISPEITGPKVTVNTVITHAAVVTTPVLLGNKVETHEIESVNTVTGLVTGKTTIHVEKPILGEIRQVMNVDTVQKQVIDLKTGNRIDAKGPEVLHGKDGYFM